MNNIEDLTRLSKDEEARLAAYSGTKYELSDGKGNIIERTDTRDPEIHKIRCKKDLQILIAEKYNEEWPQYKIDGARSGTLKDLAEKAAILQLDINLQLEYQSKKALIMNAKDCDEMEESIYKDLKV